MGCMEEMQRLRQALDSKRGALEVNSFFLFSSNFSVVVVFFVFSHSLVSLSLSLSFLLSLFSSLSLSLSGPRRRDLPATE